MRCSKCGSENPVRKSFCGECGNAFTVRCAECGAENSPPFKFCGDCGSALDATTATTPSSQIGPTAPQVRVALEQPGASLIDGERRTVTAVFADTKDSLDLIEDVDPEDNTPTTVEQLDRAGQQAMMCGAFKEAELYYKRAIAALSRTPETSERTISEFNLQHALWQVFGRTSSGGSPEDVRAFRRLRELGEKIGNPEQLILTLIAAWTSPSEQGEWTAAQRIAEQLMEIAQRSGSGYGLTMAHYFHGVFFQFRGPLTQATWHYERAIASYDESDFSGQILQPHVKALARLGVVLWHLGCADQARAKIREAISLSERLNSPASMLDGLRHALYCASVLYSYLREADCVEEVAKRLSILTSKQHLSNFPTAGSIYRGWALAAQNRTSEGIALIRAGLDSLLTLGERWDTATFLRLLSEAQARGGQLEEAVATIEQAFSAVGEWQIDLPGVLWWRGELHLRRGDETRADSDFWEALAVARRIGSKAFELRASTSLARLLDRQGKRDEARAMLAEIYNWFTEGFDTADLKDAKALLEELSGSA